MTTNNLWVSRPMPWYLRWSTWGLALLGLIGLTALWIGAREIIAYRSLEQQLSDAKANGIALDNESLATRYERKTTQEHSKEWLEVIEVANSGKLKWKCESLYQLMKDFDQLKSPRMDRTDYDVVLKDFLAEAKPLIDRIKQLEAVDKPIRMPIQFSGQGTRLWTLYGSMNIFRMLRLEMEYAIQIGDHERAMSCSVSMNKAAHALLSNFSFFAYSQSQWHFQENWRAMRLSLGKPLWTPNELTELLEIVGHERDLKDIWHEIVNGEVAMGFETEPSYGKDQGFDTSTSIRSLKIPSVKKFYWDQSRKVLSLADGGYDEILQRVQAFGRQRATSDYQLLLAQVQLPVENMASTFVTHEMHRKLTRTAIALKRYRMEKGKWPQRLDLLSEYGLDNKEWMCSRSESFGYRIESESKKALLWGFSRPGASVYDIKLKEGPAGSYSNLDYVVEISSE